MIVCCSCDKDFYTEQKTTRGKAISEVWFNSTKCLFDNMIDPAFKMNAWINGDANLKLYIEDNYFPNRQIKLFDAETGKYEIIYANKVLCILTTNNVSLAEEGAEWEIRTFPPYQDEDFASAMPDFCYVDSVNAVTIKNLGNYQWAITEKDNKLANSILDMVLAIPTDSIVPINILAKEFTLSGSGSFVYAGSDFEDSEKGSPVTLNFAITKPLVHNGKSTLKWQKGDIGFTASKAGRDDVKAEVSYDNNKIVVNYGGESETWDY